MMVKAVDSFVQLDCQVLYFQFLCVNGYLVRSLSSLFPIS